jgi:WD40 repeat protein
LRLRRILEKVPLKQKLGIRATIKEKSEVMVAKFAYEDSLAAVGTADGYVRIYNLLKNSKMSEVNTNVKDK